MLILKHSKGLLRIPVIGIVRSLNQMGTAYFNFKDCGKGSYYSQTIGNYILGG